MRFSQVSICLIQSSYRRVHGEMLIYTVAGAVPAKRKPAIESTYFRVRTFVTSVFHRIENNTGQCKHWHIIIDVEYRSTFVPEGVTLPSVFAERAVTRYARALQNSGAKPTRIQRALSIDRSYKHLPLPLSSDRLRLPSK